MAALKNGFGRAFHVGEYKGGVDFCGGVDFAFAEEVNAFSFDHAQSFPSLVIMHNPPPPSLSGSAPWITQSLRSTMCLGESSGRYTPLTMSLYMN